MMNSPTVRNYFLHMHEPCIPPHPPSPAYLLAFLLFYLWLNLGHWLDIRHNGRTLAEIMQRGKSSLRSDVQAYPWLDLIAELIQTLVLTFKQI